MSEPAARAWRVVLEKIEGDLLEGRLGPGDRLPPERELATTLGVGRSSVREAIRVLEVMGLIRTGTGSGPTSGAIIIATPQGGLAQLLRLQVAAQSFPVADILQTRLLLEEWVVDTLARDDAPALDEARATLEAMDADGLAPLDFLALDAQFHVRLAEASGNTVVAATMGGLRGSIETYVRAGVDRIEDWPSMAARLQSEHAEIVAAVAAGDPDRSRTLVRAHISDYYSAAGLARP